ncbi:MAG: hypothetical protein FJW32_19925 [Acidobacteria bacterium]|nr:hypothetical protein [Acidobacteriota bacterium]
MTSLCDNENLNELFRSVMHKPFTPQNFGSSLVQIESDIQRWFPGGVDAVVYGKSSVQGWSQVPNSKGIIAILIGIQSPRDASSGQATGKRVHKPFLKRTGALGVIEINGCSAGWVYPLVSGYRETGKRKVIGMRRLRAVLPFSI